MGCLCSRQKKYNFNIINNDSKIEPIKRKTSPSIKIIHNNILKKYPIIIDDPIITKQNTPIIAQNNCSICTNKLTDYICKQCKGDLCEITDTKICMICNKFPSIEGKSYCITCMFCTLCNSLKEKDRLFNDLCEKCDKKCLICGIHINCEFNDYCFECLQNYGIVNTLNLQFIEKKCG